jgi:microcystin-dependent protein
MAKWARHTPTLSGNKKIRAVSLDAALFPHVGDAITKLTNEWVWEKVGDDVEDVVAACKASVESWYSDMLIGSILPWIINPPGGWLLLDGSTYASADYPELSALLPTHLISGSDFILPDVENSFPFGVLDEDDASIVVGSNALTLSVAQLPAHTHNYISTIIDVDVKTVGVPDPLGARTGPPVATTPTGSGDDIDIRPKRFGLVYAVFAGRE